MPAARTARNPVMMNQKSRHDEVAVVISDRIGTEIRAVAPDKRLEVTFPTRGEYRRKRALRTFQQWVSDEYCQCTGV